MHQAFRLEIARKMSANMQEAFLTNLNLVQ